MNLLQPKRILLVAAQSDQSFPKIREVFYNGLFQFNSMYFVQNRFTRVCLPPQRPVFN